MILVAVLVRRSAYAVPVESFSLPRLGKAILGAAWAIVMPIVIVGGILGGFMTPTEAGIVAVVYSLFVGFVVDRKYDLNFHSTVEVKMGEVRLLGSAAVEPDLHICQSPYHILVS